MRLKSTLLTPTGFGNGLWGAASRRVVRNAFSVAAMIGISTLGPLPMSSVAWADEDPQSEEPVTSVTISVMGWEFTPIIQNGVIKGIFAQITPEILVEGNLETVWFEQDENGDWLTSSWAGSGTAPNALGWIRGHFADSEILLSSMNLQAQAPEIIFDEETLVAVYGDWVAPTALDGGLLEDDPLQLLLGDGPRTPEMFAMMSFNGWPVAPELSPLCSHHGDDCETSSEEVTLQQLLDALVAQTQSLMPGRANTIVGEIDPSAADIASWWCECFKRASGTTCVPGPSTTTAAQVGGGWHIRWPTNLCTTHYRRSGDWPVVCNSCAAEWDVTVTVILSPIRIPPQQNYQP